MQQCLDTTLNQLDPTCFLAWLCSTFCFRTSNIPFYIILYLYDNIELNWYYLTFIFVYYMVINPYYMVLDPFYTWYRRPFYPPSLAKITRWNKACSSRNCNVLSRGAKV